MSHKRQRVSNHWQLNCLFKYLTHSPPSAAYMRQWTGSALVQVMACRLLGPKPLSEPMLTYCQLDPKEHISIIFYLKFKYFHLWKCIWSCCLWHCSHFFQGGGGVGGWGVGVNIRQTYSKYMIKALHYWPFVREIHRSPVDSPHKWPVMLKFFLCYDVIMTYQWVSMKATTLG